VAFTLSKRFLEQRTHWKKDTLIESKDKTD